MPPLNSRATRDLVKRRNVIPGPRSLHRGIHFHENEKFVVAYKQNRGAARRDHRDLLVHHQKINEELQDVYARTAALHAENATMEERIEESWRQFERIGGKRPASAASASSRAYDHLRSNKSGVGFAERLRQVSQEKQDLRERSQWERETRGEAVDYSKGSALHAAKDKRVALFQRRQLKREHLLRRMGDPTPLKQSGRYDMNSGTLRVFNKTIRRVQRDVRHDERTQQVKERRRGSRSMWDMRGGDENPNRPSQGILRYTREFELGPRQRGKKGRRGN
ncbi:uncharacterized protein Tco025E_05064 [Trypanosoma conorhini]|uniref:Uncharacterized protein n=1 Tax=Trypanosoma conorhini TaxID=83891 RepID=A0A3S5IT87_9TRYP|nr:uncharacterized protein Tco025E_05064 [Trypanosoma conorhini]RNF17078.1 hypothetical protein Tco025E_05064 [Trypanosoma conorhini]